MKKSFIIGKRQIILGVLVVALVGAVYLNWKFTGNTAAPVNQNVTSGSLGDALLVNAQATSSNSTSSTSSAVATINQVREDRNTSENDALAVYQSVTDDAKASANAKTGASASEQQLAQTIKSEGIIETLIKAKGFTNCVAVINNNNVAIMVQSDGLLQSQLMQIQDVVTSQTNIPLANVKINAVK